MPPKATTRWERHYILRVSCLWLKLWASFGAPQRGPSKTGQLNGPGVGEATGAYRGAQIYALLHLGTWRSMLKNCFWTRQVLWKKNCLGVSAGTGDWIRGTKYRHRDSSDTWPPTLKAIYRAFRPLTTRWPLKFLNEFEVHFKFCNHYASIGKFLSALVVHFDTVFI